MRSPQATSTTSTAGTSFCSQRYVWHRCTLLSLSPYRCDSPSQSLSKRTCHPAPQAAFVAGYFRFSITVVVILSLIALYFRWWNFATRRNIEVATLSNAIHRGKIFHSVAGRIPLWRPFSSPQQADWISSLLAALWPSVRAATEKIIRDTVDPLLELYRPSVVSKMAFARLDLGDIPPEVTGVAVHSYHADEVVLDLGVRYEGNPTIVVRISMGIVSFTVRLDDVAVGATLRLVLRPLMPVMPGVGAVAVSLTARPDVTFKLVTASVNARTVGLQGLIEVRRCAAVLP